MKRENLFYSVFIAIILIIRLLVFFFPENKLIIFGTVIHHFWIGVLLVGINFLFLKKQPKAKLFLSSIGFALISDELVYMILGDGPVSNYWSFYSVSGMIVCVVIAFMMRKKLMKRI